MIRFSCSCGKLLQVRDELAGKRVRCPGCGTEQLVPASAGITEEPPVSRETGVREEARPRPAFPEEEEAGGGNIRRERPAVAEEEPAVGQPRSSSKAIFSLILGLLSFGCSILTGLPGLILGILALGEISRSGGRVRGQGIAVTGLVLSCLGMACSLTLLPFAVLIPAVQKVRDAAGRAQSMNNMKQMALAMHNYNDTNGKLPSAAICDANGKPLLSWRVAILPYLGENNLYNQFKQNEPWNSPSNMRLLGSMPQVYRLPSDTNTTLGETYYQVFVGNGAAFDVRRQFKIPFDFTDGTSNTIMIVEADSSVPWTKPEDIDFNPNALPPLGKHHSGGFLVVMMDGATHYVGKGVSPTTLKAAITRNGGDVLGSDW